MEIHMNHLMQRALHAYLLRLGERQKNTKLMQFCNYTELWRSSLHPGERRGPTLRGMSAIPREYLNFVSFPRRYSFIHGPPASSLVGN